MLLVGLVETVTVLILEATGHLRGGPHLSLDTVAVPGACRQRFLDAECRVSPALALIIIADRERTAVAEEVAQRSEGFGPVPEVLRIQARAGEVQGELSGEAHVQRQ